VGYIGFRFNGSVAPVVAPVAALITDAYGSVGRVFLVWSMVLSLLGGLFFS